MAPFQNQQIDAPSTSIYNTLAEQHPAKKTKSGFGGIGNSVEVAETLRTLSTLTTSQDNPSPLVYAINAAAQHVAQYPESETAARLFESMLLAATRASIFGMGLKQFTEGMPVDDRLKVGKKWHDMIMSNNKSEQ